MFLPLHFLQFVEGHLYHSCRLGTFQYSPEGVSCDLVFGVIQIAFSHPFHLLVSSRHRVHIACNSHIDYCVPEIGFHNASLIGVGCPEMLLDLFACNT